MVLTDKILDILNSMDSIETVMYDSGFSANVRIDRKPTPAALLYLLTDWTLDISKGSAKEGAEIEVFFFERADFDQKGEEKDVIVSNMGAIARDFIAQLFLDKSISVKDNRILMRSSYGKFDAFCVGVSVHLTIEERQGSCL